MIKGIEGLKDELVKLNSGKRMIFGRSSNPYLLLFNALDFRNLVLPLGWEIDAEAGLTNRPLDNTNYITIPVFINNELVAGPKTYINTKTDRVIYYRPQLF